MHENDMLAYTYRYANGTPRSSETQSLVSYDRRPDCFPYYKKSEKLIGTVDEKTVSDEGFTFTAKLDGSSYPALFAILFGYYPERIIHNGPATIVFWADRTKTVVKCSENDIYDPFDAFTAALAKKIYGTTSSVKTMLKKVTVEQETKKE